jgi:hypothetical protein
VQTGDNNNNNNNGGGGSSNIFNMNRGQPIDAPLRGDVNDRNPDLYNRVIDQFQVATNPRYAADGSTYCNIFAWDVTRAMGAEIPHRVDPQGHPAPGTSGHEMLINDTLQWMYVHAGEIGWRQLTGPTAGAEAQRLANLGHPAVAMCPAAGHGHIVVIRPGTWNAQQGATIAQAGSRNFNLGREFGTDPNTSSGWTSSSPISYWVNDTGRATQSNQAPAAPTNFRATRLGAGSFRLDWTNNATNATSYLQQWWDGSSWRTWYDSGANATSQSVRLSVGYTYRLRVVAYNQFGQSPSNEITVTG